MVGLISSAIWIDVACWFVRLQTASKFCELARRNLSNLTTYFPIAIMAGPVAALDEKLAIRCRDQIGSCARPTERRRLRFERDLFDARRWPHLLKGGAPRDCRRYNKSNS